MAMSDIVNYLNSPYLVASFQRVFGIESQFDAASECLASPTKALLITKNAITKGTTQQPSVTADEKHSMRLRNQTTAVSTTRQASLSPKSRKKQPDLSSAQVETIGPSSISKTDKSPEKGHKRELSNGKTKTVLTDHGHVAETTITNVFWYYFFHLGAAMGNEVFYCLFFPFWFWNVDGAIARKVATLWGIFMYVGQASKDLMCMPRPASPPVVKLEERYRAEYGFPSTHAMVSAGLPISLVFLSYSRYNIDLSISIGLASVFCLWVCCSRLYLGMHSLLDVMAGVLYAVLILLLVIPWLEHIDEFMLTHPYSPVTLLVVGFALCHYYPSLRQWSTARGDTTIIIGTVVGFAIGAYFNNWLGYLNKPDYPPLYDIHFPNSLGYVHGIVRTILGLVMLLVTRQIFKASVLRMLCRYHGFDPKDPVAKQQKKIELPYNYATYFAIGFNVAFTSPVLFRWLNIQRDYSYTEL